MSNVIKKEKNENLKYDVVDVTNFDVVKKTIENLKNSKVDILINNAGISDAQGRIDRVDITKARKVFDVNFFGVWHGCSVFSKKMIEQGTNAAIYNLGSENSLFVAVPKSVAYVAS